MNFIMSLDLWIRALNVSSCGKTVTSYMGGFGEVLGDNQRQAREVISGVPVWARGQNL